MTVSTLMVKNIFDTLPIGYYLGRRIDVMLDESGDQAYFSPFEDKIIVGAKLIINALADLPEDADVDVETIIRSCLYHEVSHVILTPSSLKSVNPSYATQINIFEDERIETILKSFYMGINFKMNIIILNRYTGQPPMSADDEFFNTVRFRHGRAKYVERVENIISEYADINAATKYYTYEDYVSAIIRLYRDIKSDWAYGTPEEYASSIDDMDSVSGSASGTSISSSSSSGSSKSDSSSSSESIEVNVTIDNNESDKSDEDKSDTPNGSSSNKSGDESDDMSDAMSDGANNSLDSEDDKTDSSSDESSNTEDGSTGVSDVSGSTPKGGKKPNSSNKESETEKAARELAEKIMAGEAPIEVNIKTAIDNAIKSVINKYNDAKLVTKLNELIDRKLKNNKNNGSAINSYSGKFNVRAVATRDDYKWWAQQNRSGHIRQFSKVHFNLFIDNSGSFSSNDLNMNKFIRALAQIRNNDFSFDVITINYEVVEWTNNNKEFRSNGGNRLTDAIADVIKRHTKSACNNYNIVLFDGDAHTDDHLYLKRDNINDPFKHFDNNNTIIISDEANKKYIEPSVHKAHVTYTGDYCNEFINVIFNLLDRVI